MNSDQKYKLLSMMGYKGPKDEGLMSSFIKSNPAVDAKMGQFMSATKGFAKGGSVDKASLSITGSSGEYYVVNASDTRVGGPYSRLANAYKAMDDIKDGKTSSTPDNPFDNPVPDITGGPTPGPGYNTGSTSGGSSSKPSGGSSSKPSGGSSSKPSGGTPPVQYQTTQNQPNYQNQINQLYQRHLDRDAQQAGMDFYSGLLSEGKIDLAGVEADIKKNAAAERTVRQMYADEGLNVDQAGLEFYTGLLNSGKITPYEMRQDIKKNTTSSGTTGGTFTLPITPTGNSEQDITALYQEYLGRGPKLKGINFYKGLLDQGIPIEQIAKDIQDNAKVERSVIQAYEEILGRDYDQAGLEFYTGKINSDEMTLDEVRADIRENSLGAGDSPGTQDDGPPYTLDESDPIQQAYYDYFGRAGDQEGLAYWINQRANGVPEEEIIAELERVGGAGTTFKPENEEQVNLLKQFKDVYRQIMGRNPDQEGLNFWMDAVTSGDVTMAEALTSIANSKEAQLIDNQRFDEARELRANQKKLIAAAFGSPEDLVTGQEVADVRPTEGTILDAETGQLGSGAGDLSYDPVTVNEGGVEKAAAAPRSEVETYKATTVEEGVNNVLSGLEAQTADPTELATVQGQLEELMKDFDGGKKPPWASGVMRNTMAAMQQRGLGASSMAGMAVVQSAMEAATNIAQQDAQTYATFELQNLNNRQQTAIFKTQQRMAGLFSDQAADNAAKQFNASSKNQYNQFREQLETQVSQFNASQINSMMAMNMEAENAAKQFNSSLENQRQQFNANNSLVVSQANAQWRQNINTINTAAQNDANRDYVKTVNAITTASLDQLWQREKDLMTFAFAGSESAADRELKLLLADKQEDLVKWQEGKAEDAAWGELLGSVVSKVFDW